MVTAVREPLLEMYGSRCCDVSKQNMWKTPGTACRWQWNCAWNQNRTLAKYLLSVPSLKARMIISARSGKLFALHSYVQNLTLRFVCRWQNSATAAMNVWGMQVHRVSIAWWTIPWRGLNGISFLKWSRAWARLMLLWLHS